MDGDSVADFDVGVDGHARWSVQFSPIFTPLAMVQPAPTCVPLPMEAFRLDNGGGVDQGGRGFGFEEFHGSKGKSELGIL